MWEMTIFVPTEKGKTMTALEYMEKQLQKHRLNYDRELKRGATVDMLFNIALKCSHYWNAVEALRERENNDYKNTQISNE